MITLKEVYLDLSDNDCFDSLCLKAMMQISSYN